MTLFFFLILTAAWVLIFFPKVIRTRRSSPLPAADMFRKRLDLLAPPPASRPGRWVHLPEEPQRARADALRRARARKRKIFVVLLAATAASLPAALVWAALWRVHLVALVALVSYIVLLVGSRRRREDAARKIRPLPAHHPHPAPYDVESASGGVT